MANKSSKGGEFEREFSKLFSKYVTGGERDDIFWRSSQSGGRATQRAKQGKKTEGSYGDISCIDSEYGYITKVLCFELKRGYNDNQLSDLVEGTKKVPPIIAFWNQCERDRELGERKFAFVVYKRDRKRPVVVIPRQLQNLFSREIKKRLYSRVDADYMGIRICIISLDEFLEKMPYKQFLKVIRSQT